MLPRIAFFPDSFHEVNGVAHTSRNFEAFARRRGMALLCVRAGTRPEPLEREGPVWTLELPRSSIAISLERDLSFDPVFTRHRDRIERVLDDDCQPKRMLTCYRACTSSCRRWGGRRAG